MKKINYKIIIVLCLIIVLALSMTTFAKTDSPENVVDNAQIIDEGRKSELSDKLSKTKETYNCDVVVLTVNSLGDKTATEYADDYYDYNDYGVGTNKNGILFLLSMEDRKWALSTCGDGIEAFTDEGQSYIMDKVMPYLKDGDYTEAFFEYADLCDMFLKQYSEGEPYDVGNMPGRLSNTVVLILMIAGAILLGAIISFFILLSMKSSMKTVRSNDSASNYIINDSIHYKERNDMFLYKSLSRSAKAESNSGGGSSTHTSSSGTTHGGSSGSF